MEQYIKNKYLKMFLLFCSFSLVAYSGEKKNDEISPFAKGCFGAAIGAALVGAAACVANYFTRPTDQQQLDNAIAFYNQVYNARGIQVEAFRNYFSIDQFFYATDEQRILKNPDEGFLNELGWNMWLDQPRNLVYFADALIKESQQLITYQNDLRQRIVGLQKERHQNTHLIAAIEKFLDHISSFSKLFSFFAQYCDKYASYFELSECGWSLYDAYKSEFSLIDLYRYDQYLLMRAIHDIVVQGQHVGFCYSDARYPYISYVECLMADIKQLDSLCVAYSRLYPLRIHWVHTAVLSHLEWLKGVLDPYYRYELLYREQNELAERVRMLRLQKNVSHAELSLLENTLHNVLRDSRLIQNQLVIQIH